MNSPVRAWRWVVDEATEDEKLTFIRSIATDLAVRFDKTGKLLERKRVRIILPNGDSGDIAVYPAGDIGPALLKLAKLMDDRKHQSAFSVGPANFVDVQPEDITVDNITLPTPGLLLSANGLPALIIGGDPGQLVLKMEGFERSIIGLTQDVPGLWENVRRAEGSTASVKSKGSTLVGPKSQKAIQVEGNAQREDTRRKRSFGLSAAGILGLVLPAMTIRPIEVSGDVATGLGGGALMVPVRGKKVRPGPYPTRPPVEILREALGVQTLLADHNLRALLGDRQRAKTLLGDILPREYGHLRDVGKKSLAIWTAFDRDGELKIWAEGNHAGVGKTRREDGMTAEINAALAPVGLLAQALNHAERIAAAHDSTESVDVERAREIIEIAYRDSRHSGFGSDTLFDIAVYGDIQPSMLWSVQDEAMVEVLEAARVLGRVRAGAKTVMSPPVLRVVYEGLFGLNLPSHRDEDVIALRHRAAAGLAELLGTDKLKRMLDKVEDTGEYILIDRRTREMKAIAPEKALKVIFRRKKWLKYLF